MGLKSKGAVLLEAVGKIQFPCLSSFQKLPTFFASWPPSVFKASTHITPTSASVVISLILTLQLPSYNDPCGYIGPTQISPDNPSMSKSLTSLHLPSPFYHVRWHTHSHLFQDRRWKGEQDRPVSRELRFWGSPERLGRGMNNPQVNT